MNINYKGGEGMLIALLITELIIAAVIVFTTYMIYHKFKGIEKGVGMYSNARAYKTESQVAFIEKVMIRYKGCIQSMGEEVNIESIVKALLYKEYIGKFPFATVKSVALKATRLMWGIVLVEASIAFINQMMHETHTILVITTSILLVIATEMFKYIKGVEDQQEVVSMIVQDYVMNVHPVQLKRSLTNKEILNLRKRVAELEEELKTEDAVESAIMEFRKEEKTVNDELSMKDIAKLIGIFQ